MAYNTVLNIPLRATGVYAFLVGLGATEASKGGFGAWMYVRTLIHPMQIAVFIFILVQTD